MGDIQRDGVSPLSSNPALGDSNTRIHSPTNTSGTIAREVMGVGSGSGMGSGFDSASRSGSGSGSGSGEAASPSSRGGTPSSVSSHANIVSPQMRNRTLSNTSVSMSTGGESSVGQASGSAPGATGSSDMDMVPEDEKREDAAEGERNAQGLDDMDKLLRKLDMEKVSLVYIVQRLGMDNRTELLWMSFVHRGLGRADFCRK
jgi:hypothetical protein